MDSYTRRRAARPRSNCIDTVTQDLKSVGIAWEDAEQAAVDREDWRGRVAQCVLLAWAELRSKDSNNYYSKQESAADAVKPARRESMQKLVQFVVETSYSLKKNLASGGIRTGDPEVKVYYLS